MILYPEALNQMFCSIHLFSNFSWESPLNICIRAYILHSSRLKFSAMPNMNSAKGNLRILLEPMNWRTHLVDLLGQFIGFVYYIFSSILDCKFLKYSPDIAFSGIKNQKISCSANQDWVLGRHRFTWIIRCPIFPLGTLSSQFILRTWYIKEISISLWSKEKKHCKSLQSSKTVCMRKNNHLI